MKAKTYRFIFSALLIFFAAVGKAQTIDGKLYTPFNNYYQWIGGKFNNNLNIPKIAAINGRDTGGIRYNLADSLMYVWTGSQWRVVGAPVDTSSLSSRINERVKYSDTAAMLANYINSASNGLTKSGKNVILGGTLTQSTRISGTNSRNFTFDSISDFNVNTQNLTFRRNGNGWFGTLDIGTSTAYLSNPNGTGQDYININNQAVTLSRGLNNQITMRADSTELRRRMTYSTDLSAGFTRFSLVHKQYVDNIASNKLNISDTAAMLAPYLRTVDFPNTDTATVVKAYVTNAEAVTITKGQVVYIFGAQGDRASVKLAKNTSDTFSSKTLGIVRADIAAGQAGWVTTQGQVSGINLGAYTAGDILWLDSVPGGFTKTKPEAPYHSVFVGVVERANAGNGLIYVKPQNGVELDELHNVKITSPTNNQVLSYTASTGIWENKTVSASIFAYTAQTTTYTAGAEDYVIHCTSGTFSVNLPTAVGITGKVYIIKNSGSGLITIDPNGSQTIDGSTTYTMSQAETVQVISTGSNWITL